MSKKPQGYRGFSRVGRFPEKFCLCRNLVEHLIRIYSWYESNSPVLGACQIQKQVKTWSAEFCSKQKSTCCDLIGKWLPSSRWSQSGPSTSAILYVVTVYSGSAFWGALMSLPLPSLSHILSVKMLIFLVHLLSRF